MKPIILAASLAVSALLVVWGVAGWSTSAARLAAGALLAGWALLVLKGDR